jgi:hypothetical protein
MNCKKKDKGRADTVLSASKLFPRNFGKGNPNPIDDLDRSSIRDMARRKRPLSRDLHAGIISGLKTAKPLIYGAFCPFVCRVCRKDLQAFSRIGKDWR